MEIKRLLACCLCLLSLLLSGCMATHKKDGPPPYPVDVSMIPNAVPKAEPLSRIGNKPTYTVFGKKYYVMQKRKKYVAVGIASWYGTQFHQRRTSNGELYNMLGMTAAHRNLPLPTYVQVSNLENGRKVIVKVNDRGPFNSNRLIDLSYAAAKKLGMEGRGTALVEVKALNPEEKPRRSLLITAQKKRPPLAKLNTKTHPKLAPLYLEIGQYKQKVLAARMKQRLTKVITHPIQVNRLTQGSRIVYQVQIGPIKDKKTAERISHRLKSIGLASKKVAYDL
jgi:rare lipoprotein A